MRRWFLTTGSQPAAVFPVTLGTLWWDFRLSRRMGLGPEGLQSEGQPYFTDNLSASQTLPGLSRG